MISEPSITQRRIWYGIVFVLTLLLVPISMKMLNFAFSISAGNHFLDLLKSGASEDFARQEAARVGHMTQFLYFFAFPFPVYLLFVLISAYFLGIQYRSDPLPLWKIMSAVCFTGGIFLTLSFSMWDKRHISNIIVGSFVIWFGIFTACAMAVGLGRFGAWIIKRSRTKVTT